MIQKLIFGGVMILATAGGALAQPTSEVDRLRAALAHRPEEATIDTALIFTNVGREALKVKVQAYTKSGDPAGSADLEVPALGLVYILASDLRGVNDKALLGHAEALSRDRRIIASAVLLGGGTTDLPVKVRPYIAPSPTSTGPVAVPPVRYLRHIFPVIAAY